MNVNRLALPAIVAGALVAPASAVADPAPWPWYDSSGVAWTDAPELAQDPDVLSAIDYWRGEIPNPCRDAAGVTRLRIIVADRLYSAGRQASGLGQSCALAVTRSALRWDTPQRWSIFAHEIGHAMGLVGTREDPHADRERFPIMAAAPIIPSWFYPSPFRAQSRAGTNRQAGVARLSGKRKARAAGKRRIKVRIYR